MRSPAAHILETALALQRAPGERFRLRERPLPPGVIHLIEVAAGSPQVLGAASADLGEREEDLVEAARFYLEQVLFADPDADAYRVLGVAPDVPQETIRIHQRWLQRWLHPDRAQAGDASVFATRVNQAFAQLRSPESRHAYDVRLAEARLAHAGAPLDPRVVRHWERDEAEPMQGDRSRWLVAAALLSCLVLAVLIVRSPDRGAEWYGDDESPATTGSASASTIEDRDLQGLTAALAMEGGPPDSEAPAAKRSPPAAAASSGPLAAATVPPGETPNPFRTPTRAPAAVAAAADGAVAARLVPPARIQGASAEPSTSKAQPPPAIADGPPAPAVPAAESVPAPPEMTASATKGAAAPVDMFNRMREAERRVAQVTAYLASRPGAAPMWNDPQIETEAARLRIQLNARKGSKLELARPSWRLQSDSASLSADYRCRPAGEGDCRGRLDVKLVWREGLWLVRGVGLEPSA